MFGLRKQKQNPLLPKPSSPAANDFDIIAREGELNQAILNGQALEAFERYYHDDVVMQENDTTPTIGKDANRDREHAFFDAITEFRGAKLLGNAIQDNLSFSHWHFDFDHRDWGKRDYRQVGVREWRDGQVIRETFYYG